MPRTFSARYPGGCAECPAGIQPGEEVMYDSADQLVHVDCAEEAPPSPKNVCPQCNLTRPCEHDNSITPEASAARLARLGAHAPRQPAAPVTMTAAQFFGQPAPAVSGNGAAAEFFSQPAQGPSYTTLEEEVEAKVERDNYDRPLIIQPDGGKKPYNRASSYGGQLDDKTNVEKWSKRQVIRGIAIALRAGKAPAFLDAIDERLFDPWADQQDADKKLLNSLADRAQDMAGSNLKSQLGTDIHYATELIDLGESLEHGLRDFEPGRRRHLMERADAYYKKIQEYRIRWDSVETFGVQDDLEVAGTWDRRGFVPWWPEHQQVIGDVKTSSSMDFAGITFAVQLATYAHMDAYDIATGARAPHDDMNEDKALIVHVAREMGGEVELYPVNIDWGWRHARLAREIIVARREGSRKGPDAVIARLDDREALIRSQTSRDGLNAIREEIMAMPKWLRQVAEKRWEELG